jgi:hypothetical protein
MRSIFVLPAHGLPFLFLPWNYSCCTFIGPSSPYISSQCMIIRAQEIYIVRHALAREVKPSHFLSSFRFPQLYILHHVMDHVDAKHPRLDFSPGISYIVSTKGRPRGLGQCSTLHLPSPFSFLLALALAVANRPHDDGGEALCPMPRQGRGPQGARCSIPLSQRPDGLDSRVLVRILLPPSSLSLHNALPFPSTFPSTLM